MDSDPFPGWPPVLPPDPLQARPLSYATTPPPRFPDAPLGRRQAVRDLFVFFSFVISFSALTLLSGLPLMLEERFPRGGRFLWVPINGLLCLGLITWLLSRRGQRASAIGLGAIPMRRLILATLAAVPLSFLVGIITNTLYIALSSKGLTGFARERGEFFGIVSVIPLGWIVPLSIFVGIYEEIVFRGFLLSRLQAISNTRAAPILVSSAIFGLFHFTQGVPGMCQTAMVGLVLAIVAVRTRSIWPCILAHTIVDTLGLLLAVLGSAEMKKVLDALTTQASS